MLFPFQILAVVGSAAFAGMMLAIALILGPYWRGLPPADFVTWFAANSGLIARAIPVVAAPTLLGLIGSIALSWGNAGARTFSLAAAGFIVGIGVLTVAYFFPINASFSQGAIASTEVPGRIEAWLAMHWVRVGLAFVAAVLACLAIRR